MSDFGHVIGIQPDWAGAENANLEKWPEASKETKLGVAYGDATSLHRPTGGRKSIQRRLAYRHELLPEEKFRSMPIAAMQRAHRIRLRQALKYGFGVQGVWGLQASRWQVDDAAEIAIWMALCRDVHLEHVRVASALYGFTLEGVSDSVFRDVRDLKSSTARHGIDVASGCRNLVFLKPKVRNATTHGQGSENIRFEMPTIGELLIANPDHLGGDKGIQVYRGSVGHLVCNPGADEVAVERTKVGQLSFRSTHCDDPTAKDTVGSVFLLRVDVGNAKASDPPFNLTGDRRGLKLFHGLNGSIVDYRTTNVPVLPIWDWNVPGGTLIFEDMLIEGDAFAVLEIARSKAPVSVEFRRCTFRGRQEFLCALKDGAQGSVRILGGEFHTSHPSPKLVGRWPGSDAEFFQDGLRMVRL